MKRSKGGPRQQDQDRTGSKENKIKSMQHSTGARGRDTRTKSVKRSTGVGQDSRIKSVKRSRGGPRQQAQERETQHWGTGPRQQAQECETQNGERVKSSTGTRGQDIRIKSVKRSTGGQIQQDQGVTRSTGHGAKTAGLRARNAARGGQDSRTTSVKRITGRPRKQDQERETQHRDTGPRQQDQERETQRNGRA